MIKFVKYLNVRRQYDELSIVLAALQILVYCDYAIGMCLL